MQLWRLCRKKYVAFDGEGARLAGGRWNRRGTAVVYTSATLSLAVLEYFVNLPASVAPPDLVMVRADLAEGLAVKSLDAAGLPRNWRQYPAPESLAEMGSRWAEEGKTPVLAVPSAVVPQEKNYLLNPAHPDFRRITIGRPEPFSLDLRMWKK
ncbi:MAG TPA: RES family NAD+ phosphorylase [Thermoanaerobaculia bacterium]|nr:RES family NAD+ phosphorylase [Thermoanaerobaculia bacterium]